MTDQKQSPPETQLFVLRLWSVQSTEGPMEWHGQVQPVYSNQAYAFSDWPELMARLEELAAAGRRTTLDSPLLGPTPSTDDT